MKRGRWIKEAGTESYILTYINIVSMTDCLLAREAEGNSHPDKCCECPCPL